MSPLQLMEAEPQQRLTPSESVSLVSWFLGNIAAKNLQIGDWNSDRDDVPPEHALAAAKDEKVAVEARRRVRSFILMADGASVACMVRLRLLLLCKLLSSIYREREERLARLQVLSIYVFEPRDGRWRTSRYLTAVASSE